MSAPSVTPSLFSAPLRWRCANCTETNSPTSNACGQCLALRPSKFTANLSNSPHSPPVAGISPRFVEAFSEPQHGLASDGAITAGFGPVETNTTMSSVTSSSNGSPGFIFGPGAATPNTGWRCSVCSVRNDEDAAACASCETPKAGKSSGSAGDSLIMGTPQSTGTSRILPLSAESYDSTILTTILPVNVGDGQTNAHRFSFGVPPETASASQASGSSADTSGGTLRYGPDGSFLSENSSLATPSFGISHLDGDTPSRDLFNRDRVSLDPMGQALAAANAENKILKSSPNTAPSKLMTHSAGSPQVLSTPRLLKDQNSSKATANRPVSSDTDDTDEKVSITEAERLIQLTFGSGKPTAAAAAPVPKIDLASQIRDAESRIPELARPGVNPGAHPAGTVFTWGSNDCDQLAIADSVLGDFNAASRPRPALRLQRQRVAKVACGALHSAALLADGALATWGCNDDLCLGREGEERRPARVECSEVFLDIACGDCHTAAINKSGECFICGTYKDHDGYIGFPVPSNDGIEVKKQCREFTKVPLPRGWPCIRVRSGENHTAVLMTCPEREEEAEGSESSYVAPRHRAFVWGSNEFGQLGKPVLPAPTSVEELEKLKASKQQFLYPVEINTPSNSAGLLDIFLGRCTTFLKTGDDADPTSLRYYAAGRNCCGELGLGFASESVDSFTEIEAFRNIDFVDISSCQYASVGLTREGVLWTWGKPGYVGRHVTKSESLEPAILHLQTKDSSDLCAAKIGTGSDTMYCVTKGGAVLAWGEGQMNQIGDGKDYLDPVVHPIVLDPIDFAERHVLEVAGGSLHAVARVFNGEFYELPSSLQVETQPRTRAFAQTEEKMAATDQSLPAKKVSTKRSRAAVSEVNDEEESYRTIKKTAKTSTTRSRSRSSSSRGEEKRSSRRSPVSRRRRNSSADNTAAAAGAATRATTRAAKKTSTSSKTATVPPRPKREASVVKPKSKKETTESAATKTKSKKEATTASAVKTQRAKKETAARAGGKVRKETTATAAGKSKRETAGTGTVKSKSKKETVEATTTRSKSKSAVKSKSAPEEESKTTSRRKSPQPRRSTREVVVIKEVISKPPANRKRKTPSDGSEPRTEQKRARKVSTRSQK